VFLDLNVLHSFLLFLEFFLLPVMTDVAIVFSTTCRFQQNMASYQNLITQSMYDKQLDSGKGTLLHLCDDVIQQEVSLIQHVHFFALCNNFIFVLFNELYNVYDGSTLF
jgi:hypothetical protein